MSCLLESILWGRKAVRKLSYFPWHGLKWGASQVALVLKNLPANAGDIRDAGSIPVLGRSHGRGHGNTLRCSCLENPMHQGAWWATVHRVTKSQTWLKWLSKHTCTQTKVVVMEIMKIGSIRTFCESESSCQWTCWTKFALSNCETGDREQLTEKHKSQKFYLALLSLRCWQFDLWFLWWTWVWVNSGRWGWTGRPGVPQFTGSQRVGHDWATKLNWSLRCSTNMLTNINN